MDNVDDVQVEPEVVVPDVILECHDYSLEFQELRTELQSVNQSLDIVNGYLAYTTGFVLFFVVVALCVFGYKFIRLFV